MTFARRPLLRIVAALVAAASITSCTSVARMSAPPPTWEPKPEGPAPGDAPAPDLPGDGAGPSAPGGPGEQAAPGEEGDPGLVAKGLKLPWGLAVLPDNSAIVGERATGRILRVRSADIPPQLMMTVKGIDATGDGGLLDLVLSPSYRTDQLVYAYITTATDNRVVRFELGESVTPVLTGIPKAKVGNGGRLAFGPDGSLYVGTGDAGRPAAAADPRSKAGKVLKITTFGKPAPGNTNPASPVFTSGHRDVEGLCLDRGGRSYVTETGSALDEVNMLTGGKDYGWPDSAKRTAATPAAQTLDPKLGGVTGCAVVERGLFVTTLRGQRLWAFPLQGETIGEPRTVLNGEYGRLRTVVAGPDGTLWLTTSNRDGSGKPGQDDDRVIRLVPPASAVNSPV